MGENKQHLHAKGEGTFGTLVGILEEEKKSMAKISSKLRGGNTEEGRSEK